MAGYLEGKNIVITGAGNGIGKATALAAAAEGANVLVADYGVAMDGSDPTSDVADAVVTEITEAGGTAMAIAGDVSKMEVGEQIITACVDTWGSVDGVVCVAGNLREKMLFNMSEDEWDAVIAVHLKGHFTLYRHALAVMRKQETGGAIIGFTSGAFQGSTAQANYSAAKGGIVSLTKSTALTMASLMMRGGGQLSANCIAPVARTRMSENVPFGIDMGVAEDVAPMALYLLSDAARHINGQIYTANGPHLAVWSQPVEVRTMDAPNGRWTPQEIEAALPDQLGIEKLTFIEALEERMAEMEAKKAAEGDS